MKNQGKEDKSYVIALLLLLLAGFFVILYLLPEKSPSSPAGAAGGPQSKQFEERVNRHLFNTSQTMELSREKMKLEADRLEREGVKPRGADSTPVHPLDLSTDPRAEALLKALGREATQPHGPANPDEQIQAELFESQQLQEYSEEYKREYARQFIENARKAGYIIKLNDDYKVISVRPLRKPAENFELFQSDGRALR